MEAAFPRPARPGRPRRPTPPRPGRGTGGGARRATAPRGGGRAPTHPPLAGLRNGGGDGADHCPSGGGSDAAPGPRVEVVGKQTEGLRLVARWGEGQVWEKVIDPLDAGALAPATADLVRATGLP